MHSNASQDKTLPRTPLRELFPEIEPYSTGYLPVGDGHELYWEQSGNPDGVPVLFVHGGPGSGTVPMQRRFFDPGHYRIILYDQRGAGRSTPHGETENNTVRDLVNDMEKLRNHLSVERWHIFGGSWGSTLSLSYAVQHADRCRSLILRGIFLMEQPEIDWWLYGIRAIFPEPWERFASFIPMEERHDLLEAYHRRLNGPDPEAQMEAAIRWSAYESSCAALIPNHERITTQEQKNHALTLARLECHYFRSQVIPMDKSLLNRVDSFRSVPAVIIHGRYDMICPIYTAHRLHKAWPEADYIIVPEGAHTATESAIRSRLIEAAENAKTL